MSRKNEDVEILARGVCVRDGMLLVCRTGKAPRTYLPGGHVEFGEAAREGLRREVREELGCGSRVGRFLGVIEHSFVQKGKPHHEVNLVFEMTVRGLRSSDAVESEEKHLSFKWVRLSRLQRSDLEPAPLRRLIPMWLRRKGGTGWASTMEE